MRFNRSSRKSNAASLQKPARPAAVCHTEALEGRTLFAAHFHDPSAMLARFTSLATATVAPLAPFSSLQTASKSAPAQLIGSSSMRRIGDEDGCIARARTAKLDYTREGMLSYEMDTDIYKVTAQRGQRITIDIDNPSWSNVDTMLRVFDAAGNEVASNNDAAGPGELLGTEAYIDFTFPTTNTYYVGVSGSLNGSYNPAGGFGDQLGGSTGDYTLRIRNYVDPDPNDELSQASAITTNSLRTGTISSGDDVDMYRFSVSAGQTVSFDVDYSGAPLDSVLRVFNSTGAEVAKNDDGTALGETPGVVGEAYVRHTFAQTGTYYVAVSGKGNESYDAVTGAGDMVGATGAYSLQTKLVTLH